MRRLETPARARSMVSMIKTLGERLSTPSGMPVVDDHVPPRFMERPTPPLPPVPPVPLQSSQTHLKTLQRR
jgi:hypothetical protein